MDSETSILPETPGVPTPFQTAYPLECASGWCCVALAASVCIKLLAYGFSMSILRQPVQQNEFVYYAISGAWTGSIFFDFGMVMFMFHCLFLFPSNVSNRFIPALVGVFLVGMQLAFASVYMIPVLLAYLVAIAVTGWLVQRVTGLSLSMGGEEVYRRPLSVGVYVLLPALLMLLGVVPTMIVASWNPGSTQSAAITLIYSAILMLVGCAFPLFGLYITLSGITWRRETKIAGIFALFFLFFIVLGLAWRFDQALVFLWGCEVIAAGLLGVFTGYSCFHLYGYRLIWAKRLVMPESKTSVSFDDVE